MLLFTHLFLPCFTVTAHSYLLDVVLDSFSLMGHWTFMYAFDVFPHRKKKMEKSWVPFHHLRTSLSSRVSVQDRSMRSPSTLWRTTRGDPRRPEESPPVSLNWWSKTSCICIPVEILLTQPLWNIFEKVSSIYRGHGCQSMSHLIWPLFTQKWEANN